MILNESNVRELILELGRMTEDTDLKAETLRSSAAYRELTMRIDQAIAPFTSLVNKNSRVRPLFIYMSQLDHVYQEAHKPLDQRETELAALINEAWENFRMNIEMLEDLAVASLDDAGRQHLSSLIKSQGFTVTQSWPLEYKKNENWGTRLVAKRLLS